METRTNGLFYTVRGEAVVGAAPVPLALGLAESTVSIQPQRCLPDRFHCDFLWPLSYRSRGLTLAEVQVGDSGYSFPD
ncbi:MAG: hypothetical protein NZ651_07420 [Candidatus Bipolaricaulota bacterium]|nr:hypothetical protein [Candidatus Bipolaricaulota bacterium]MDW8127581.1 hypothetical protein [Candidatus Bipolaricaulota bacterium]